MNQRARASIAQGVDPRELTVAMDASVSCPASLRTRPWHRQGIETVGIPAANVACNAGHCIDLRSLTADDVYRWKGAAADHLDRFCRLLCRTFFTSTSGRGRGCEALYAGGLACSSCSTGVVDVQKPPA